MFKRQGGSLVGGGGGGGGGGDDDAGVHVLGETHSDSVVIDSSEQEPLVLLPELGPEPELEPELVVFASS